MQRMQRKFGTFLTRSADDTNVAVALKEFEEADNALAQIIEGATAWRLAWRDLLAHQITMSHTFEELFQSISGHSETLNGHQYVETPEETLGRAVQLKQACEELKIEVMADVEMMEEKLIKPAVRAKDEIKPMKKVIKKREDRKLDYERYKGRVDTLQKKAKLSDRETIALVKHEADLSRITQDYHDADEHLRQTLPGITATVFSLLPQLLATQILIQNTLLGQLYTTLHNFCLDHNYPSPPPELRDIVSDWDGAFTPLRMEIEGQFSLLLHGKAVHQPMTPKENSHGSITGLNLRNGASNRIGFRKNSQTSSHPTTPRPPISQSASAQSINTPPPDLSSKTKIGSLPPNTFSTRPRISSATTSPSIGATLTPYASNTSYNSRTSSTSAHSPSLTPSTFKSDSYFSPPTSKPTSRIPSHTSISSLAAKKKPPPPPPKPKRIQSTQGDYVTALYDYHAAQEGDLGFREGDRIRVVRKTESADDWWEGELEGVRGSFPANYVRVG